MSQPLNANRMAQLRQRLLQDKRALEARVNRNDHYQLAESQRDALDELSVNDNHPGDLGTEMFERSKDISLLERDALRLKRIDEALARMASGEYGRCLSCGAFISADRLDAMPTAAYCVEHEPRQEPSERRPIEERFLQPPFGRTSMDENDQTAFDGEDAWQIVASWGNSNSPALAEANNIGDYDAVYPEADENDGFVEPIENFVATDITGKYVSIVRGRAYRQYLEAGEGYDWLQSDEPFDQPFDQPFGD